MANRKCLIGVLLAIFAASLPAAAQTASDLSFDIAKVPFSRFGSYLAISRWDERVLLRSMHGGVTTPDVFRLQLTRAGKPVTSREIGTPTMLTLRPAEGEGAVEIVMAEPKVVRIRGRGVALRLERPSGGTQYAFPRGTRWLINSPAPDIKLLLTPVAGKIAVNAPWNGTGASELAIDITPDAGGTFEVVLEEFTGSWRARTYADFEAASAAVGREYGTWLRSMPSVPPEFGAARELAAYVNWSAAVGASGNLPHPAVLMSKNWMTQVWTWDHCFNAMALVKRQPDLAWKQLFLPFAVQSAEGALPDSLTDRTLLWAFSKPPIHGWTLRWMLQHGGRLDRAGSARAYASLAKWTEWYFRFRDDDGDGLPEYQHGNDSGWDNATVFAKGVPVESPDLAAFLVVQMDVLGDVARKLGKPAEARQWKARADRLLARMIERMWRGDHFVALNEGEQDAEVATDSLLLYVPLVLGKRLPPEIAAKLVAGLREPERFLTAHGLATESPRSARYVADGYWLGPIWAPSTMLIVSGLDDLGERELANEIRRRFCRMASAGGMAENFDALTGKPLRDPAYTWTSSVFLIFADELAQESARR